jgi:hypothetical protein
MVLITVLVAPGSAVSFMVLAALIWSSVSWCLSHLFGRHFCVAFRIDLVITFMVRAIFGRLLDNLGV